MAYVGTPIDTQNQFQSLQGKRFSGDGSTTAFTLDIAPSSVFDIEVFVENVRQDPNSAYGISGTTLTFTGAPPSGTNNIYVVHQAKAVGTIDVPASGVVPASLASNIISGQTELAATPADTDEFLISDAGTIKRIDFSHLKQANTPAFSVFRNSEQTGLSNDTFTKVQFNAESFDTDNAFDSSSNYRFTVPSGEGGKYQFNTALRFIDASSSNSVRDTYGIGFYVNGSIVAQIKENCEAGLNQQGISSSIILSLSASDYVEVFAFHEHGSGTAKINGTGSQQLSWFSGFKLIGA